eukprot:TRINITY_DN17062_c0_g1_i6.p1 TRINITY_DN17062_c0_g1~~TRINITY_DN17062_c0_g1_i6.p1  ORF type:complete len:578 (+),score=184.45 TRINITY_DN17062_c0_g1_i6:506-2239(+)
MRIRNPAMKAYLTKNNPHLLSSLKAKKLQVKAENLQLHRELKKLRKTSKYTLIKELEAERTVCDGEAQRLQEMLGEVENANELIPLEDAEAIKARIKEQNSVLDCLTEEQKVLLVELKQREAEIVKYKRIAEEDGGKVKEIERLKAQVNIMKKAKGKAITVEELEELKRINKTTELKIIKQKDKIRNLEQTLEEIEAAKKSRIEFPKSKNSGESRKEAYTIAEELQGNLRKKGIEVSDMKTELFERVDNNESVSVHELAKTFSRQPCALAFDKAIVLAEWLVNAGNSLHQKQYTEERALAEVLRHLGLLLNVDIVLPETSSIFTPAELENLTEDDLMLILQKFFAKLNEKIITSGKTIPQIFSQVSFTHIMDEEEVDVVNTKDFLEVCEEKLKIRIEPIERLCFTKMISLGEDEKLTKLKDIEYILKGFEHESEDFDLDFSNLDSKSMVLLFALTEYILNSKITLYDIFGNCIYTQDVETDGKELRVELINSREFFNTLSKIGISIQNGEHENLKDFLCIDPEYPNKLVIRRLKKTIEEFALNSDLRSKAYKHYQELADEESDEEINKRNNDGKKTV